MARLEAAAPGGDRAAPHSGPAALPEDLAAAMAALEQRIGLIEHGLAQAMASLDARNDAAPTNDATARLAAIEAQNGEIQMTLQSLLPMLMRRAS